MHAIRKLLRCCLPHMLEDALREAHSRRAGIHALTQWTAWDDKALDFYRQFLPLGSTCFDVGANVGNRSKIFAKLARRVIAVEPQASCQFVLASLCKCSQNVTVTPKALGKVEGVLEMHVNEASQLSTLSREWMDVAKATGRFGDYHWGRTEMISVTTLDRLIEEFGIPDFVKIDVEGYELQVLEGLSQSLPALSFEFVPERLPILAQCLTRLRELGPVAMNYALGEDLSLRLVNWLRPEPFLRHLRAMPFSAADFGDVYVKSVAD